MITTQQLNERLIAIRPHLRESGLDLFENPPGYFCSYSPTQRSFNVYFNSASPPYLSVGTCSFIEDGTLEEARVKIFRVIQMISNYVGRPIEKKELEEPEKPKEKRLKRRIR